MTRSCLIFSLALILILTSCAEQPKVMSYFPESNNETDLNMVWPPPPEVPHYRYAGQLQGETNFIRDKDFQPNTGEKVFNWLVGLSSEFERPKLLSRPQDGMVGPEGRIYVTDVGNQAIFVFDDKAGKLSIWSDADKNNSFVSPIGIASRSDNEILVADSQLGRVIRLDLSGNPVGSIGAGILQRPTGLAIDKDSGHIYVADTGEHNIKVFNGEGNLVNTIGEPGEGPGQFNAPTYLCISNGFLYVSDTLNARVQKLTIEGKPISIIGQRGLYIGNFTRPKGITADSDGNIYVIESYYDHLLIFSASGDFLLPIGGTGTEIGYFYLPAGIWSDSQDRIFTADMLNGRVIIMQYMGE